MTEPTRSNLLALAAQRAAQRGFFLASAFRLYQSMRDVDDASLAQQLGTDVGTLDRLRLCRRPSVEAEGFRAEVQTIAHRFGVEPLALAQLLRELSSLEAMRSADEGQSSAVLMAARDRERAKRKKDKGRAP